MCYVACVTDEDVARRYELVRPELDEEARRLVLGAEAVALGRGGTKRVAEATGAHPDTLSHGRREVRSGKKQLGRIRRPGAGRRRAGRDRSGSASGVGGAGGSRDPRRSDVSLRWTTKSTGNLSEELAGQGHQVPGLDRGPLLTNEHEYSLQGNAKTIEGKQHPDRDAQFRYLNAQADELMAAGYPVITVDTKNKELVGPLQEQWQGIPAPGSRARAVNCTTSRTGRQGGPLGVYDVGANSGWVNVGRDADTWKFAVAAIRRWWSTIGKPAYPDTERLLISADSGGANGPRPRLWKTQLAQLATETGLEITVCHLPPGTSKWNKSSTGCLRDHPELAGQTLAATRSS